MPERRTYQRNPLDEQHQRDLIVRYVTTTDSIHQIAAGFGVKSTYPYRVLEKRRITWRRDHPISFADWLEQHPDVETWLKPGLDLASPVTPLPEKIGPDLGMPSDLPDVGELAAWTITITEKFPVMAHSIEGALDHARKQRPHARITSIRLRDNHD